MYSELLGIKKKDVISIIGAGGKTSLMYSLAKELSNFRTLVTTTTRIFIPYNYTNINGECLECGSYIYIADKPKVNDKGIYIVGKSIVKNKIIGYEPEVLSKIVSMFDYTIIEADGSNRKFLKAWNETEPVILKETTKTLGVISLKLLGKTINLDNIHRLNKYIDIVGAKINDSIDISQISALVRHENGLFKKAVGEKILLVNIYDDYNQAYQISEIKSVLSEIKCTVNRIIVCNIKRGVIFAL